MFYECVTVIILTSCANKLTIEHHQLMFNDKRYLNHKIQ